jgi:two-component system, OmpR family, KDP operon response regulator KdpE
MTPKKILVVDDDLVVLKAMSMKLTANGYDVVTAEDGAAAMTAVRRGHPALILLDVGFPPDVAHGGGTGWNGLQIMSWMRRFDVGKTVPVIVMTASESAKLKDQALAEGAVAFFQKPVNNDELLTTIRETLAKDTSQAQPESAPVLRMAG